MTVVVILRTRIQVIGRDLAPMVRLPGTFGPVIRREFLDEHILDRLDMLRVVRIPRGDVRDAILLLVLGARYSVLDRICLIDNVSEV